MKRPTNAPAPQPAARRTHSAFRFLFGSWSLTGLVMLAASIAALLLATGCGGGSMDANEPTLLATSTSSAQGGDATTGLPLVAAPLVGPTVSLDAPSTVQVVVHITWVQQFLGVAELAFSVTPGTAAATASTEHSAGLGQPPQGSFSATSTWCVHLPAGQHTLNAVARLRAANSAGAPSAVLGTYRAQAQWQASAVHTNTCQELQQ